jgi:hypothetical protein
MWVYFPVHSSETLSLTLARLIQPVSYYFRDLIQRFVLGKFEMPNVKDTEIFQAPLKAMVFIFVGDF